MADVSMKVSKVADRVFMGRDIVHCAVMPKEGDPSVYAMVYQDKVTGKAFAKKFQIGGVTRDKLYPLAKSEGSRIVYFQRFANEAALPATLHISLDGRSRARVREFDFDFSGVSVSNRGARGLTVTRWPVKAVAPAAS